ncbi:hypothetical protein JW766_03290 [Candidatus Dojkabacteria bacterium]|nr:hypothetical protein [Candidatus Dojkabacteria bacterium]
MTRKKLKATQLVVLITKAYKQKKGVFEKRVNAEDWIPASLTVQQKALFLFYVIQLDYATKSQRLYKGAQRLWTHEKNYFDPKFILKQDKNKLTFTIKKTLSPRYINEAVKRWTVNSKILLAQYSGNPLNIFKLSKDSQVIIREIYKFRGFGPKIGNFFFRTIVNTFNLKLDNLEQILMPVDVHDVRLTNEWGLINTKKMTPANVTKVKQIWKKACNEVNISWLIFDKALWILGSEGKRTDNPEKDLEYNLELKGRRLKTRR